MLALAETLAWTARPSFRRRPTGRRRDRAGRGRRRPRRQPRSGRGAGRRKADDRPPRRRPTFPSRRIGSAGRRHTVGRVVCFSSPADLAKVDDTGYDPSSFGRRPPPRPENRAGAVGRSQKGAFRMAHLIRPWQVRYSTSAAVGRPEGDARGRRRSANAPASGTGPASPAWRRTASPTAIAAFRWRPTRRATARQKLAALVLRAEQGEARTWRTKGHGGGQNDACRPPGRLRSLDAPYA